MCYWAGPAFGTGPIFSIKQFSAIFDFKVEDQEQIEQKKVEVGKRKGSPNVVTLSLVTA